jgi:hypothetical protein
VYKTLNHVLTSSTNFNQKFLISLPRLGPVGAKPWARIVGAFLQGRRTQPGERATNILHLYKVGNAIFFSSFFFFWRKGNAIITEHLNDYPPYKNVFSVTPLPFVLKYYTSGQPTSATHENEIIHHHVAICPE